MGELNTKNIQLVAGWRCDSCGQLIPNISAGWVEWLADEDDQGNSILRGVRLVHGADLPGREHSCRYDCLKVFRTSKSIVEGLPLERFVGPDGLMLLLSLISSGELPKHEILELAKRVQIPRYELARAIPQRIAQGVCRPLLGPGYYLQSELQELIAWAKTGIVAA